ncbi:response regulator receiver protein [Oscillochloris trichoides DG-6]|uniref:Response regulator receiver protein n=1 Tax=Oscillochloris trichoides DG-6 TaxID=765420 RepID=E1IBY4_9CHLR|nr:response regulator [Oscillochloris trichoides]EFO81312.1 response regulator receiver protein [Oscillochloris trichoides DG-6]
MPRILVVEDDETIREMVATYLRLSGFTVELAVDGIDALTKVRSVQPELIIMDMGIPKLNGWQTTQRLRARKETAQTPIIALTAYALEEDRERAFNVGCDAFESKPIDFTSLIEKIQTLLARSNTPV